MKILYISHLHPPKNEPLKNVGGMQNVSLQLLNHISREEGVEVESIIMNSSWKFIGVKTTMFLLTLLYKIPAKIKSFQPDVILFSSMVTASVLPLMPNKQKIPCVTINHGQDVTLPVKIYQWHLRKVFGRLDGVISVSSATRKASIKRGLLPEKGIALPNGFDISVENKLPPKHKAIKVLENEFSLNLKDKRVLLTVGRLIKRKGHSWFISEVFDKVKSDIVFILVGFGPEHEQIIRAKEKSENSNEIIIAGKVSDKLLNACYSAADLFVMPNIPVKGDMEGFGIVLLEANRASVPAISADLEGMKDVIKNGVNGYRVEAKNSFAFAQKIDEVLQNNLEALSRSSKKYVMENFGWETVVKRYITFLTEIINRTN